MYSVTFERVFPSQQTSEFRRIVYAESGNDARDQARTIAEIETMGSDFSYVRVARIDVIPCGGPTLAQLIGPKCL